MTHNVAGVTYAFLVLGGQINSVGGGGEGLAFYLYLFKEGLKSFVLLKTFAKDFLSNASEKYYGLRPKLHDK